ncbi:MAG: peptidylprolyl isomerase [Anaerolineales bacterium]
MPKNRNAIRTEKRLRKDRQKIVQIVTIGMVILVAAAVIVIIVYSRSPKTNAGNVTSTAPAANNGQAAPTVAVMQFATPPPMQIDVKKQYFATVKMVKGGEFVIQLYPDKAPITVNSFVFLARKGFYNGVTFHRVLEGFMAQGGDPTGTGMGGPGYTFVNEKNDLLFDKAGVVAMANAGPDTNGSQFFIMFGPYALSENDYTIFGQVVSGIDVVNGLTRRDPTQNPNFPGDAIESITISEK